MGLIEKIIYIALVVVGIILIIAVAQIPYKQNDCLKEVAEDYCEDNGMEFSKLHILNKFSCIENERLVDFKIYNFLEDEIEECKDRK